MKLTLEPWSPEYDTSFHADPRDTPTRPEDVNIGVELEPWGPVQPSTRREVDFTKLYFVDGRRRLEAKVWAETTGGNSSPGLLGTFAVGVVQSKADALTPASILDRRMERVLVLADNDGEDLVVNARGHEYGDLRYKFVHLNESQNQDIALEARLQYLMRELEDEMGSALPLEEALLVVDGPLQRRAPDRALGYVKTLHNLYVSGKEVSVLQQLQRGQRTPIFLIASGLKRYSWYLRLEDVAAYVHPYAGLVRLEVRNDLGLEWAQQVADWSCQVLPKYSAKAYRDPRAPQQLMPIAFLESELGRRMGDMNIIRRRIQAFLREQIERARRGEPREETNVLNREVN
ncbi:MAG: hypothetical protein HC933_07145 [Pleurocapsa sp. SU_196_0]|nr:hypothetical protein [Pleurocapsa sp. SU_196_0]